jgi:putrescine transport system ATP-binding protein
MIGGEDMAYTPPNKRPTNMVFQSYAVFPAHDGGRTSPMA